MNEMLNRLGMNAKAAETEMRNLSTNKKNEVLLAVADKLVKDAQTLISANRLDVETGKRNHMPEGLIDRLLLTESRIEGMAEGLRQVASLDDPVGEVTGMKKRPNGLLIGQKRVPLGVVAIIYESSVSLSIRAGFIPLALALTRSFSLAAIILSALAVSASATASSALFFSSIPSLARYLDAFLALIPICSSDSINSPSL